MGSTRNFGIVAVNHAPLDQILAQGFDPPEPRGPGLPFRFLEAWSCSCPVPRHLRGTHTTLVWVNLPAGRAQGYHFISDGCGNVLTCGINEWIYQDIIARAIPAAALLDRDHGRPRSRQ